MKTAAYRKRWKRKLAGLKLLTEKKEKRNKGFFKIKLTRGTKVKLKPKKMTNVTL